MRIKFDFDSGNAAFPAGASARVSKASDTALRLLIILAADPSVRQDFESAAGRIAKKLNCTRAELNMALAFWCGAGIADIEYDAESEPEGKSTSENTADDSADAPESAARVSAEAMTTESKASGERGESDKEAVKPAEADGRRSAKLMRAAGLPEYTSEELGDMLEQNGGALAFVDEAQRRIGRMFNPREVSILIGLKNYLELDERYIYVLIDHCARVGKTSMRYIETVAFGMYDEGVTDSDELETRLAEREAYATLEGKFRSMTGIKGRRLTAKETRFLNRWSVEMKYGFEMIELAYEITADTQHEYNPAYMNGILERWYAAAITTPEQVSSDAQSHKKAALPSGSFDTDEFFEAALQRSYSENK